MFVFFLINKQVYTPLNLPLLLGLCDMNTAARDTNCDIYDIWQWIIIVHSTEYILMH